MKIYLVQASTGDGVYTSERIVAAYLSEMKANQHKEEAEEISVAINRRSSEGRLGFNQEGLNAKDPRFYPSSVNTTEYYVLSVEVCDAMS